MLTGGALASGMLGLGPALAAGTAAGLGTAEASAGGDELAAGAAVSGGGAGGGGSTGALSAVAGMFSTTASTLAAVPDDAGAQGHPTDDHEPEEQGGTRDRGGDGPAGVRPREVVTLASISVPAAAGISGSAAVEFHRGQQRSRRRQQARGLAAAGSITPAARWKAAASSFADRKRAAASRASAVVNHASMLCDSPGTSVLGGTNRPR